MRIIDLTDASDVTLWQGRRLLYRQGPDQRLFALPKGAASVTVTGKRAVVSLGGLGRTTCQIITSEQMARSIMDAIIEAEKPKESWVLS